MRSGSEGTGIRAMEEGEKRRKQQGNDAISGTRKKARDGGSGVQTEVTDDEVEEFFAILRRIHVAVRYFERGANRDGRQLPETGSRLRRTIERECAGTVNGVKSKEKEEGMEETVGFDLNADPDPEENPI